MSSVSKTVSTVSVAAFAVCLLALASCDVRAQSQSSSFNVTLNYGYTPGAGYALTTELPLIYPGNVTFNGSQTSTPIGIAGLGQTAGGLHFLFSFNAPNSTNYANFPNPGASTEENLAALPIYGQAVVFVTSIPGITTTSNPLFLPPDLAGRIYCGNLTYWDDPALQLVNPNIVLPHLRVKMSGRALLVSHTGTVLSYLLAASPSFRSCMSLSLGATKYKTFVKQVAAGAAITVPWIVTDPRYATWYPGQKDFYLQIVNVTTQVGFITYEFLVDAKHTYQVPYCSTSNAANTTVVASSASVAFALNEQLALPFTSTSTPPIPVNTQAVGGWPIVAVNYIVFTTQTMNGVCTQKTAAMQFIRWLYTDPTAAAIASLYEMVPMPPSIVETLQVLDILDNRVYCGPSPALPSSAGDTSFSTGTWVAGDFISTQLAIYTTSNVNATSSDITLAYDSNNVDLSLVRLMYGEVDFAVVVPMAMQQSALTAALNNGTLLLPLASFSIVPITGLPLPLGAPALVLDPDTVAKIISGAITLWSDPYIVRLNPVLNASGLLPPVPIVLVISNDVHPDQSSAFLRMLAATTLEFESWASTSSLDGIAPTFSTLPFPLPNGTITVSSDSQVEITVEYIRYSLGFVRERPDLRAARVSLLLNNNNNSIVSGPASRALCFPTAASLLVNGDLNLASNAPKGCWWWSAVIYVALPAAYNQPCSISQASLQFVSALFQQGPNSVAKFGFTWLAGPEETVQLNAITCDGETVLVDSPVLTTIPTSVISVALALLIVGIVLCFFTLLFVVLYRKRKTMKAAAPWFLVLGLCGICILLASGYVFADPSPTDSSCQMSLWLACIGFFFIYGPLFAKQWRIYEIFSGYQFRMVRISDLKLSAYLMVFWLVLELPLLLAVQLSNPMRATRTILPAFPQNQLVVYCAPENGLGLVSTLVGVKVACLIAAAFLAFASRTISKTFSDAVAIAWLIWMTVFSCAVAAALGLLLASSPISLTLIIVFSLFWMSFLNWGIIYAPLWYHLFQQSTGFLPDLITDSLDAASRGSAAQTSSNGERAGQAFGKTLAQIASTLLITVMDRAGLRYYLGLLRAEVSKVQHALDNLNQNEDLLNPNMESTKASRRVEEKSSIPPSNGNATRTTQHSQASKTPHNAFAVGGSSAPTMSRGLTTKSQSPPSVVLANTSSPLLLGQGSTSYSNRRGTAAPSGIPVTGGPGPGPRTYSPSHHSTVPTANRLLVTTTPPPPLPGAVLVSSAINEGKQNGVEAVNVVAISEGKQNGGGAVNVVVE